MTTRPQRSIRWQLMRLSTVIVVVSTLLSLAGTLYLTLSTDRKTLDHSLLNSASLLAQAPIVRQTLVGTRSESELAEFLDAAASQISDIDLILVGDKSSTLHYASDPAKIGQTYPGTAQYEALAGQSPYTSNETGPLGTDHSAYAPVYDTGGNIIGFVVVGVYMRSMTHITLSTIFRFVIIGLLAMGLGCLFALQLSNRIKKALLGYEPDAFARRFHQREDILEALEEGIVAIDKEGTVIFLNQAAAQMLSQEKKAVLGQKISRICPQARLDQVLQTQTSQYNWQLAFPPDTHILEDRLPLYEDGQLVGAIGIFRNRTELTRLGETLSDVRHMVEAMRAYTHEFMNKLHVILGLLEIGAPEKARDYILNTTRVQQEAISRIMHQIQEPAVAALLIGKTSRANELGIQLTLDQNSFLKNGSGWLPPEAYVTILGNLLENAIESLNQGTRGTKQVTVSIRESADRLLLCVEDTGPGIPAHIQAKLFDKGVSSKGKERGTGLALVQEVVSFYHGSIRVESEAGVGTSFFLTFRHTAPGETKEESSCTES